MKLLRKLRTFFGQDKLDTEMAEEMREHLERRQQANVVAGMSPDEARFAAQRQFGGLDQLKELARAERSGAWLEQAGRDLGFGVRSLAKNPGFTAIAVLSLGLGIGACTAIFSLASTVLLRSLPVPSPHELRVLKWTGTNPRIRSFVGEAKEDGNRVTANSVSPPMFFSLREQATDVADVFAFAPLTQAIVRARREAFTANALIVSDNFFTALGVRPFAGRLFAAGDANAAHAQQVVITDGFWEKHLARDPAAIGQPLTLNGVTFTIIGILPRSFRGVQEGESREFYVLLAAGSPFLERPIDSSAHWWIRQMARMKPTATDARLKAVLDVVFPREAAAQLDEPQFLVLPGAGGQAQQREYYRKPLLLMAGIVTLVMLVVCSNVAGLSLARGAAQQHEFAVRAALGAGRWRLLRQSFMESLLLALLGSVLGVFVAVWSRNAIPSLLAGSAWDMKYDFSLDFTLLGSALLAGLVTALLAGSLPAWRASRVDPLDGLKARGALGVSRLRMGNGLVVAQIGLSLLLLSGAGLFVRSLVNLEKIDAGFRTDHLLVFRLNPAAVGFTEAERSAFYGQVQSSLAEIPGVRSASMVMHPLLENADSWSGDFRFKHRAPPPGVDLQTNRLIVGETFFETIGLPILQGRAIRASEVATSMKAIVVNETFVREYLRDENPLGQIVSFLRSDWQIVGVCRDAKTKFIKEKVPPVVYFSFRQYAFPQSSFVVRTELAPLVLAEAVRRVVGAINPEVPVMEVTAQEELVARSISQERLMAILCSTLAGLALGLSCIGLYGLMAYKVTRRTGEIGIRMALGAEPATVARSVLREALGLAAVGIAIGIPVALGATRLLGSQLYQVPANDPLTLTFVSALLIAVAFAAAWVPAWRATRVDPLVALRTD